jgi:hypothetical protein
MEGAIVLAKAGLAPYHLTKLLNYASQVQHVG